MSKQYRKKKWGKTPELSHSKETAFKLGLILPTPQKSTSSNLQPSPTVRKHVCLEPTFWIYISF